MNKRLGQSASLFAIAIGCLVLLGWQFNISLLKTGFPGSSSTMKANTALCFLLLGLSLRLLQSQRITRVRYRIAQGTALLVIVIGGLTLCEYSFYWNLGIDQLLVEDVASTNTLYPGRMGVNTAINFILMGMALFGLGKNTPQQIWLAQIFSSIAAIISLLALVGHLFGIRVVTQLTPYTNTQAIHTGITFLLVYGGLLLTQPQQGLMQVLTSPLIGGMIARRLMLWAIVFPLLLNGLTLQGYKNNWYDITAAYGIQTTLTIVSFFVLVWWTAYLLNKLESDRLSVQKSLTESQHQFQQAVEAANLGTWCWDRLRENVILSPQAEMLLGLKPGSFEGTYEAFVKLFEAENLNDLADSLQVSLLSASGWHRDYQILDPDGSQRWITTIGKFLYDSTGEAVKMIGIIKDITHRKQVEIELEKHNQILENLVSQRTADLQKVNTQLEEQLLQCQRVEEALQYSQARLTGILEIASDAIISVDGSQKIIQFNQEAEEVFGYRLEEVLGQSLSILLPERFQRSHHHSVEKFAQNHSTGRNMGRRGEVRGRRKDGTEFPAEASISNLKMGHETIMTAIVRDISDRKQTEESLRISEERWQLALRGNNDGIWDWDVRTNEVFFSTRWKEMLGYQDSEIANHLDEWAKRVHSDDLEPVTEAIQAHFAQKTPFYISEHRVLCKDGSYKWILDRGQALWDETGKVIRMAGSHTDITERKKIEQALQQKTAEFEAIFECIPDSVAFVDKNRRIHLVNSAFTRLFGYLPDEVLGKSSEILYVTPEEYHQQGKQRYNLEAEQFKKPYQIFYRRKNGTTFIAETVASTVKDEQKNVLGFIGITRDITEYKEAQEKLTQFRNVLENAVEGISQLDTQGRYLKVNKAYANNLGYEPEEMIGMSWQPSVHPSEQEKMKVAYQKMLAEGKVEAEVKGVRKDGSVFYKQVMMISAYDQDQQFIGHYCFAKDISDRKEAEMALRISEKRYRAVVQDQTDLISRFLPDSTLLFVNDAYCRYFGVRREEIINKSYIPVIYEADRQKVAQRVQSMSRENPTVIIENRVIIDGKIRWTQWVNRMLFDEQGNLLEYQSVGRDITKLKDTEEALRSVSDRLQHLLMASSALIFSCQSEGDYSVTYISENVTRILGYEVKDVLEDPNFWINRIHPNDIERILATMPTLFERGEHSQEYRFRHSDGSYRWLYAEMNLSKYKIGTPIEIVGYLIDITERKHIEKTLQQYATEITDLYNNAPCGYHSLDENGLFIHINDTELNWLGYTRDQMIGSKFFDLLTPQSREIFNRNFPIFKQQGWIKGLEFDIVRSNGTVMSVMLNATAITDVEGNFLMSRSTIFDISDRKEIEKKLQETTALQKAILNSANYSIISTSVDGTIVTFNAAAERLLGYKAEEVIGKTTPVIIHDRNEVVKRAQELSSQMGVLIEPGFETFVAKARLRESDEYEWSYIRKDGTRFPVLLSVTALRDPQGNITGFLGIGSDITERKQAETALRDSEKRLQLALEASGDGLWDWDIETGEVYYSPRYLEMLGYNADEFPQDFTTWEGLVHPEDLIRAKTILHAHLQDNSVSYNFDYRLRNKSGQWQWIADYGKVLAWDKDGKPVRMLGTHKDISERKRVELELQKAKEEAIAANQAKSIFLANMSHELRTPLNAILGFTQLLVRDRSLTSYQEERLQIINRSGEHLLGLIDDILDLSKIETGQISFNSTEFDLHHLLLTVEEIFLSKAAAKGLRLIIEKESNLPAYIETDQKKLRQVLINLLGNAIKFTHEGSVTLRVKPKQKENKPYYLIFEVEDTGVGIAPQEIESLFAVFVQAEAGRNLNQGSGLGLAISKKLVELMGGQIQVQSTLNKGSIFSFEIEVKLGSKPDTKAELLNQKVIALAPGQPVYRLLVVEDVWESRRLLVELLCSIGFEVKEAKNGAEALALCESWSPHLIWMDIRMPVMNGYEATQQIKHHPWGQSTVIIALTASVFDNQRETIVASGCDDIVSKPFTEEVIFNKLAQHLGVQYIYETVCQPENPIAPVEVSREDLLIMPPEWLEQVYQAAYSVDADLIQELIEQIPPSQVTLIHGLTDLVNSFNTDKIMNLIQPLVIPIRNT